MRTAVAGAIQLATALAIVIGLAGCSRSSSVTVHRYTTRGIVQQVPSENNSTRSFRVKHEPIDRYTKDGKIVGMNTMIMPFPLAEGVTVADIEPGDKVRIRFEVRTDDYITLKATKVTKLPDDTDLTFGKAQPPER
jgi:Cu/Ag efflux protein CusF